MNTPVSSVATLLIMFSLTTSVCASDQDYRFNLGDTTSAAGYEGVDPSVVYGDDQPFGLDGGNQPQKFAGTGSYEGWTGWTADGPFRFSVRVPEGNYRVRVLLGQS